MVTALYRVLSLRHNGKLIPIGLVISKWQGGPFSMAFVLRAEDGASPPIPFDAIQGFLCEQLTARGTSLSFLKVPEQHEATLSLSDTMRTMVPSNDEDALAYMLSHIVLSRDFYVDRAYKTRSQELPRATA